MEAYKARHLVENAFADLKQFRGIATRYCKLALTFGEMFALCYWLISGWQDIPGDERLLTAGTLPTCARTGEAQDGTRIC